MGVSCTYDTFMGELELENLLGALNKAKSFVLLYSGKLAWGKISPFLPVVPSGKN